MKNIFFILSIYLFFSCWNGPAINYKYNFKNVSTIRINKIDDYENKLGSGQIIEDNLSYMFMKYGFDVSNINRGGLLIHTNNNHNIENILTLDCTITKYTDSETILIPYRIEDRGSTETIITQSTESGENKKKSTAKTSTTTTTDGGSIQESGKIEYTQAKVGIILKMKDEMTDILVWSQSYWYSGIEISRISQIVTKNAVSQISKLIK